MQCPGPLCDAYDLSRLCDAAVNGLVDGAPGVTVHDSWHTKNSAPNWLWIDLGANVANYHVSEVTVHPQACCQWRTQGRYRLCNTQDCSGVSDADAPEFTVASDTMSGLGIEGWTYQFDPPVFQRQYLRFHQRPNISSCTY